MYVDSSSPIFNVQFPHTLNLDYNTTVTMIQLSLTMSYDKACAFMYHFKHFGSQKNEIVKRILFSYAFMCTCISVIVDYLL